MEVGLRVCWRLRRLVVESDVGFGRSDLLRKSFIRRSEMYVFHRRVCNYTCYCEATVPPKDGSKHHIGFSAHSPQPCNYVCHPHVTFH